MEPGCQGVLLASILNLYRQLLRIRRARPSLHKGSIEVIDDLPDGVLGFIRADADERTIVLVNFTEETKRTSTPDESTLLISTDQQRSGIGPGVIRLGPNEALAIDPGPGAS